MLFRSPCLPCSDPSGSRAVVCSIIQFVKSTAQGQVLPWVAWEWSQEFTTSWSHFLKCLPLQNLLGSLGCTEEPPLYPCITKLQLCLPCSRCLETVTFTSGPSSRKTERGRKPQRSLFHPLDATGVGQREVRSSLFGTLLDLASCISPLRWLWSFTVIKQNGGSNRCLWILEWGPSCSLNYLLFDLGLYLLTDYVLPSSLSFNSGKTPNRQSMPWWGPKLIPQAIRAAMTPTTHHVTDPLRQLLTWHWLPSCTDHRSLSHVFLMKT